MTTTYILINRPTFQLGYPAFQPSNPPTLTYLALALALALTGLALAALLTTAGVAILAALNLALLPTTAGLGLALACAYLEIRPCYATSWPGV